MKDKEKEKQIVIWLSEGRRPPEIGELLKLTPRTVESYIGEILEDYEAKNSPHLVGIFYRKGLIPQSPTP